MSFWNKLFGVGSAPPTFKEIMEVSKNGHKDVVQLLLNKGADVNAKNIKLHMEASYVMA